MKVGSSAKARLADGFARLVGGASSQQLERMMRTHARRPLLGAIFSQMPGQVDRKRAAQMEEALVRWQITEGPNGRVDVYELLLADGRCRTTRGESDREPQLTITADGVEFLRLITGNSDPMRAYFSGKVRLAGDVMFAAKLQTLFRIPGAPKESAAQQP
jgi:putative sterol carrier protein